MNNTHSFMLGVKVRDEHMQWFKNDPIDYLRATNQLHFTDISEYDLYVLEHKSTEFNIPPLRPDPALVWQVEGDEKTISRYRKAAEEAVALADRIERGEV